MRLQPTTGVCEPGGVYCVTPSTILRRPVNAYLREDIHHRMPICWAIQRAYRQNTACPTGGPQSPFAPRPRPCSTPFASANLLLPGESPSEAKSTFRIAVPTGNKPRQPSTNGQLRALPVGRSARQTAYRLRSHIGQLSLQPDSSSAFSTFPDSLRPTGTGVRILQHAIVRQACRIEVVGVISHPVRLQWSLPMAPVTTPLASTSGQRRPPTSSKDDPPVQSRKPARRPQSSGSSSKTQMRVGNVSENYLCGNQA